MISNPDEMAPEQVNGEAEPDTDDGVPMAAVAAEMLPDWDVPEAAVVEAAAVEAAVPVAEAVAAEAAPAPRALANCPLCQAVRVGEAEFCFDCGFLFSSAVPVATPAMPAAPSAPGKRLANRYEIRDCIGVRGLVTRYQGLDHGAGNEPVPVTILQAPEGAAPPIAAPPPPPEDDEIIMDAIAISLPATTPQPELNRPPAPPWPGLAWERYVLSFGNHPGVPRLLDTFTEDGQEYVIEDAPAGQTLWDAWEDPSATMVQRFEWLAQAAEALHALHSAGAIFESLRPEYITITAKGQAVLSNVSELLPIPLPADAQVRGSLYTAPELIAGRAGEVDARADLYGFGAMLCALYLGRELTENEFEKNGNPKHFVLRFPDVHPAFARIMMKTFVRNKDLRFPTDETVKHDPTGFEELARVLRTTGKSMSFVRLDIACWTNTGIVRTGNEDAFTLMHSISSRQDDLGEWALVILCDGMGGYEAGEVAAAMTIDHLRESLIKEKVFAGLTTESRPGEDEFDVKACQNLLEQALKDASKAVFTYSRTPGKGKPGMGCTAEVVYVDGQRIVVGHVGDSRTYHYSDGRLKQVTRDQTLVNRLVELGQLSAEEAENHPRKNELQQAMGGRPFVEPAVYHAPLKPGDWVIVCSDGLINHVKDEVIEQDMIQRGDSAEMVARRLVNLANLQGGSDNTTVVVIRAT